MTRTTDRQPASGRSTERAGRAPAPWLVLLIAVAAGVVVRLVAAVAGVDLVVRTGGGTTTVGILAVLVAGAVVGLAAWGVRVLLARWLGGGHRAWLVLCAVVALLSMAGPLGATTAAGTAFLVVEHLAVGAVLAVGLAGRRDRAGRVSG
ncbi:DUF6069 family protein [Isoptericola aurantiacus]|uniref:DUF6069 family protein n=1 Tax=Isoptericola aurantiacus TaxID=3377839 RepID=UPI00383A7B73